MKTKEASEVSPTSFIRAFYEARQTATPDYLLQWLAPNVRWLEPVVGDHMGFLEGADAVLTMLRKAYETTKGTFRLEVTQTIESGNHCSAVVQWEAEKNGKIIHGQELAVFGVVNGLISEAYFFASNIKSDEQFWA